MSTRRILIKLGGAALDGVKTLESVAAAVRGYRALGFQAVIVHGGGPAINAELTRRGITWNFLKGQRITTPEMIDVIEGVLCGSVNRRLVRYLGSQDLPVVGFSGADHGLLRCTQLSRELGQVGSVHQVNTNWLKGLMDLENHPVPVIAPIGVGIAGESYNINADWAASYLAASLGVEQLIFLTDQSGILDEEGQVISAVDSLGLQNMKECRVVSGGMLVKTEAMLHALKTGVATIRVMKGHDAALAVENPNIGTICQSPSAYVREDVRLEEEVHAAV